MARGRKSEFPAVNLNPEAYADAISAGDIKLSDLEVTVDKDADKKPVKVSVKALHAVTDAGASILLSESGHFIRACNRYIDSLYAANARKNNQPFEKKFADSIAALMAKKGISKADAIERLRAVLE